MKETPIENVIQQGLRELESARRTVEHEAKRILDRTQLEIGLLKESSERDVFKDAEVLAVGEFMFDQHRPPRTGDAIYASGGPFNMNLRVVQARPEISSDGLRAMLVIGNAALGIEHTGEVVRRSIDDVQRESEGLVPWVPEVKRAVGRRAAGMFKTMLKAITGRAA